MIFRTYRGNIRDFRTYRYENFREIYQNVIDIKKCDLSPTTTDRQVGNDLSKDCQLRKRKAEMPRLLCLLKLHTLNIRDTWECLVDAAEDICA